MVRWAVGSILHCVPTELEQIFVPARAPNWCNKGCGMWYPVCGMLHIKEPLLLAHLVAAGFLSRYLSGPLPYV